MSRIFLTGDCHGNFQKFNIKNFPEQKNLTRDDYVIILGDFGLWHNDKEEQWWLKWLNDKPFTTLFLDGNHENFDRIYSDEFKTIDFAGGKAQVIAPNILHLCRGHMFHLGSHTFFVFGGASSHDIEDGVLEPTDYATSRDLYKDYNHRYYKLNQNIRINHISWWKEELPSEEEMERGLQTLEGYGYKADYILTHSLPTEFASAWGRIDYLTDYFQYIKDEKGMEYQHWFSGHYHVNANLSDKDHILYEEIVEI